MDLFAGAGGFTLAAERVGIRVAWAADHWPLAVQAHAANHPRVMHACQDLQQADWGALPSHDILLASPQCTGHAWARGRERPHHDKSRATAWAVVSAAEACRPPVIVVENVPEFRNWDSRDQRPKGELGNMFMQWRSTMQTLGYACVEHVLDAADSGVPQHRVRLFCVFTRSCAPLLLKIEHLSHRPARDFIDFHQGTWKPVHAPGRAAATLARYEAGKTRYGDRFLLPFYGTARCGRSLDRPIGTITTSGNHHAVVDGDRMRMLSLAEARAAMGFPAEYVLAPTKRDSMRLLGNAVAGAEMLLMAIKRAA